MSDKKFLTADEIEKIADNAVKLRAGVNPETGKAQAPNIDKALSVIDKPLAAAGHNPDYIARQRGHLMRCNTNAEAFGGAIRGVLTACLEPASPSAEEVERRQREAEIAKQEAAEAEAEAKEAEAAAKRADADAKKARAAVKAREAEDAAKAKANSKPENPPKPEK